MAFILCMTQTSFPRLAPPSTTHFGRSACHALLFWIVAAGLLANLTCILAELYDMQEAMSVTVNPEWVVPYTTDAEEYQNLLDEFLAYVQVSSHAKQPCMRSACTSCIHLQIICFD